MGPRQWGRSFPGHQSASLPPERLACLKTRLLRANGTDALALFDEYAWDIIVKAQEEEMRSGGLEKIFPTAEAAQYTAFLTEESHALVPIGCVKAALTLWSL